MERLTTNTLHVVLGIKEGSGFGFTTHPLVVTASLHGNQLETDEKPASNDPQFQTELIWEVDKKYLRNLRIANTAVKVECFLVNENGKRQKIGYVLLNLKQAQVVQSGSTVQVAETWHRLLGVHMKKSQPIILLTLKVEEAGLSMERSFRPAIREASTNEIKLIEKPAAKSLSTEVLPEGLILIGPPEECTESYELTIGVSSSSNLCTVLDPADEDKVVFQFSIFGTTFHLKNESGSKAEIPINSTLYILSQYFKQFPSVTLKVFLNDSQVGMTTIDMKKIFPDENGEKFYEMKPSLSLETRLLIDCGDPKKLPQPYLIIFVSFECRGEEKQVVNDPQGSLPLITSSYPHEKQISADKSLKVCSQPNYDFPPVPSFVMDQSKKSRQISKIIMESSYDGDSCVFTPSPQQDIETQTEFTFFPIRYVEKCPCRCEGTKKCEELLKDEATRVCEELEDWKEKQEELFKKEMIIKYRRKNEKLVTEWMKRQNEMEEEYKKRLQYCQNFSESLESFSKELTTKSELVMQREKELLEAEEELSRQYSDKFYELQEASKRYRSETDHKMNIMKAQKDELRTKLEISEREKEALQKALDFKPSKVDSEQTAALIVDVKCLEEKLKSALESKAFFKEQWARAVREIHTLKMEQQEHLKQQIIRNQQEIGLVEALSRGEKERKEDHELIQNLKEQLTQIVLSSSKDQVSCRETTDHAPFYNTSST